MGGGVLPEAKFEKNALHFFISATVTEISVKNSVWGPVDWVGGGPPRSKIRRKKMYFFLVFFLLRLSDRY